MKRAFTLVETLMIMVVLLLVTLALSYMLVLGKATWQTSLDRSAARQSIDMAGRKIAEELRNTQAGSVSLLSVPSAFSFASALDDLGIFQTNSSGDPSWQHTVVYYHDATRGQLRRRDQAATTPTPLTPAQLAALCNGSGSLLLSSVDLFSLSLLPGNGATLQLRVQTSAYGAPVVLSYQTIIFMRN